MREAKSLLLAGEPSGAYYLSGYVVEFALKSCIAKQFRAGTWPDKALLRGALLTHDLERLLKIAKLEDAQRIEALADPLFLDNWILVKAWNPETRYASWNTATASDMVMAMEHRRHGVLRWLRKHW